MVILGIHLAVSLVYLLCDATTRGTLASYIVASPSQVFASISGCRSSIG